MNNIKRGSIMELVEFKKDDVYCDSSLMARKFGIKHTKVTRTMETLIPKLDDFRGPDWSPTKDSFNPRYLIEEREYRGRRYTAYLLNRDCFIILAMRFETKRAREWQGKFIAAFNRMEDHIQQSLENKSDKKWLEGRRMGKQARLEETDVIKEFVEYATNQRYLELKEELEDASDNAHLPTVEMVKDLGMREHNGMRVHWAVYKCNTCKRHFESRAGNVKHSGTKECKSCAAKRKKTMHGDSSSSLFKTWQNMKSRCENKKNPRYKDYGGRGIKLCDDWANEYLMFKAWSDVSNYNEGLSIERIDVNGQYCPENCIWITMTEQSQNKRGGVYERNGKWVVSFTSYGVKHYLGQYDTEEEAIHALRLAKQPHITNATYKALDLITQRKPRLRDSMDKYELSELMLAERLARNSLKKYMALGRHYKDIYESVKEDLIRFGEGIRFGRIEDKEPKYKKIA